jgi:hypothetical protein
MPISTCMQRGWCIRRAVDKKTSRCGRAGRHKLERTDVIMGTRERHPSMRSRQRR